jgi:hypothetical protein
MKAYKGRRNIAPLILYLDAGLNGKFHAPTALTSITTDYHWITNRMGLRAGLVIWRRNKVLSSPEFELQTLQHVA